ncbi:hypothetical protein LG943_17995 [Streptomonospora sp. S1-112]|uniref:Uncharacterized protein n=1 Tax=Streptomonospora mangrovi TaxID=2883123 RepID=A0A9X3NPX7_9ACTN|nr:hypothetical protein [Streptomonospora mangrovi]MDA0566193.1 hypothetical protein [Streptomonospora mangrovi]
MQKVFDRSRTGVRLCGHRTPLTVRCGGDDEMGPAMGQGQGDIPFVPFFVAGGEGPAEFRVLYRPGAPDALVVPPGGEARRAAVRDPGRRRWDLESFQIEAERIMKAAGVPRDQWGEHRQAAYDNAGTMVEWQENGVGVDCRSFFAKEDGEYWWRPRDAEDFHGAVQAAFESIADPSSGYSFLDRPADHRMRGAGHRNFCTLLGAGADYLGLPEEPWDPPEARPPGRSAPGIEAVRRDVPPGRRGASVFPRPGGATPARPGATPHPTEPAQHRPDPPHRSGPSAP